MKRIGILSDTHHFLDPAVFTWFEHCDEIWHAGDFGNDQLAGELRSFKPFKGVYGNIDGGDIRSNYPEQMIFSCEQVKVLMRHIGGAPPKYTPEVRKTLQEVRPQLFISGHSHICKVIYDPVFSCLHINPGAAGRQGWHTIRTIVRLVIDGNDMRDAEVIELGKRGAV
jgi:putative phosphoesterase